MSTPRHVENSVFQDDQLAPTKPDPTPQPETQAMPTPRTDADLHRTTTEDGFCTLEKSDTGTWVKAQTSRQLETELAAALAENARADREIEAVLKYIPNAIRVREGGASEDLYASLAVSVTSLQGELAAARSELATVKAEVETARNELHWLREELSKSDNWMREMLVDYRVEFDDHPTGRRLALNQFIHDLRAQLSASAQKVEEMRQALLCDCCKEYGQPIQSSVSEAFVHTSTRIGRIVCKTNPIVLKLASTPAPAVSTDDEEQGAWWEANASEADKKWWKEHGGAVAEAGKGEGWQPIETAPKDETYVLCFNSSSRSVEVLGYFDHIWRRSFSDGNWGRSISHWMPLPAAPEQSTEKEGQ